MPFKTLFIDLDETIYPASSGLWEAIRKRLDLFLHDRMNFTWEEIPELRSFLFTTYGTTLRGLQILYKVDEVEYLRFVHDVPLEDYLQPDQGLRDALLSYPQRKFILTNADFNHARRVLGTMNLLDCFDGIIDIIDIAPYCKPMPEAFKIALEQADERKPSQCVLVDDTVNNLAVASRMGFYTVRVGSADLSGDYHAAINLLRELPTVLKN
jgi:putative hydrolase of the HAD superfamily